MLFLDIYYYIRGSEVFGFIENYVIKTTLVGVVATLIPIMF